jgi:hypothetical protein
MTSPSNGQEVLDGPPPSPMTPNPATMTPGAGPQPMPSFEQLAKPMTAGTPGRAVAPEIAMGMMQSAETISGLFDSMASIAPDLANDFALLKDLLERTMGKLLLGSGQTASPAALGTNFPGGGFGSGMQ